MTKEEIFKEVRERLGYLDNNQLFDGIQYTEKEIEDLFVRYLKLEGYKVSKRPSMTNIKHIDQLVSYFYSMLEFYGGEGLSLISNREKDLTIMSRFVKQRQDALGCSSEFAISDCALIIKVLFDIKDELNFDAPLGIWIFGTDKCRWITDKIIGVINDKYQHENDFIIEERARAYEKECEGHYTGFNFEEIRRRRQLDGEEKDDK